MNEEKVTRENAETWRWTDWGEEFADCVCVWPPGHSNRPLKLHHESEIRSHWPEKVKARIRAEILKHRPAGEDEFRDERGLWQFRMYAGNIERRCFGLSGEWDTFHRPIDAEPFNAIDKPLYAAARTWRDRQWQDVPGAEEWRVRKRDERTCEFKETRKGTIFAFYGEWSALGLDKIREYLGGIGITEPVISACCKLLGVERSEVCPTCNGEGKVWFRTFRGSLCIEDHRDCHTCNPELAPDQVRFDDGTVGRMRMAGKCVKVDVTSRFVLVSNPDALTDSYWEWPAYNLAITSESQRNRVREFARRNGAGLAGNEIRSLEDGEVYKLRWHNGFPQTSSIESWSKFNGFRCPTAQKNAIAWFRANCPADRFVTDDGRVLEFRMRDDGEAETIDGSWMTSPSGPHLKYPHLTSLYRFRDHERGRWVFELEGAAVRVTNPDGTHGGYWLPENRASCELTYRPSWVRARAQAMWEERQPKKVTFTMVRVSDPGPTLKRIGDELASLGKAQVTITIEPIGGE